MEAMYNVVRQVIFDRVMRHVLEPTGLSLKWLCNFSANFIAVGIEVSGMIKLHRSV